MHGIGLIEHSIKMSPFLFKALAVLVILDSAWLRSAEATVCPANGIQAGIVTQNQGGNAPQNRYLLTEKGTINCYGVIREWIFRTNDGCAGANIYFEVWRPTATAGSYVLVGVNRFTSADCPTSTLSNVTFGIAPVDRIPVEPGYVIGWCQPSNTVRISFETTPSSPGTYLTTGSIGIITPGNAESFANQWQDDFSLIVTVMQGEYPTIDNLPTTVNWNENALSPSVVFTVIASHIYNNNYNDAVQLAFAISPATAPFTIQNATATNGIATISTIAGSVIDYETQNIYQLSVTVTGLELSTTKVLTINVVNVNEAHIISNLPDSVSVPAPSTAAGAEIFKVLISDPDTNPTIPVKYYLAAWSSPNTIKDAPPFVLNPDTGSITSPNDLSSWHLHYSTTSPYPGSIIYDLTILTTDGIYNKQEVLTITITNVKQPPVFLNLPQSITIDENLPGNTVIYQVLVAASPDPVTFQIIDPLTPFCIDEFSGMISLCSYTKFDYCKNKQNIIQINATNSVLSSVSSLTVNLRWINSPPSFNQPTYTGTINEKCAPTCNQFVTTLVINDRDLSCNPAVDSVSCAIIPGKGSQYFSMSPVCSLTNTGSIDLDTSPEYENIILLIQVKDNGPLFGYAKVFITVRNINNFPPVFAPTSSYVGSVAENAPGGTSVLTVTATDEDSGTNGEFKYSILTTDPAFPFFEVEPTTGLVKTKQPLDKENLASFTFFVHAVDSGTPPLTGTATVKVNILDVNDVRPVIDCSNRPLDEPYPPVPCFYNFDLKYDALIGQNVSYLKFSASDVDPQPNSITFNLLVPDQNFNMSNQSGLISVKKSVQEYTKYLLYVYAADNGSPSLWSRIMNVRIDTYRPDRQYIDLTVRPKTSSFNQDAFLAALRNVTYPWFMKIASRTDFDPNVQLDIIVTVYALADTSSYVSENIVYQKMFVDRDEMLNRLRANIYGDPAEILNVPILEDEFPVIKVMPTYMYWWFDTVEGIATIVCLSVLGLILLILAAIGICKCLGVLCFKKNQPAKPAHAWVDEEPKTAKSNDQDSVRYRSAHARRESVMSVHSIILDRDL